MQTLKLGLPGAEQELPTKSRINEQGASQQIYQQAQSINGTCNTDYIGIKDNWTIAWEVLTDTDMALVESIVNLQYTNGTHLSFIYTDAMDAEYTKTVFVELLSKGALGQRDIFFTNGVGIGIKEC